MGSISGPVSAASAPRLGDMLVERGIIRPTVRDTALARQTASGQLLGAILTEMEALTADQVAEEIKRQAGGRQSTAHILARLGMPAHHLRICLERQRRDHEPLTDIIRDWSLLPGETIAKAIALENNLEYFPGPEIDDLPVESLRAARVGPREYRGYVPIAIAPGNSRSRLSVAVADTRLMPEAIGEFKNYECHFHVASGETCQTIHRRFFAGTLEAIDDFLSCWQGTQRPAAVVANTVEEECGRHFIALLLRHACYAGASRVSLQRAGSAGLIRLKLDGTWTVMRIISKTLLSQVVETMRTELNRAHDEQRFIPPDLLGRYAFHAAIPASIQGHDLDVHIQDSRPAVSELVQLGFSASAVEHLKAYAQAAAGVVLVCGPADSGRTTTLRAMLRAIDPLTSRIQSIEAGVKVVNTLWQQSRLQPALAGDARPPAPPLAALLDGTADKILIGELRDPQAVQTVFRSAVQGRLLVAAIDAMDGAQTVDHLEGLGIRRHEMSSLLRGVVSQRLVRKLCNTCKLSDDRVATDQALAGLDPACLKHLTGVAPFRARPGGCTDCSHTGYRGRRVVYELLHCGRKVADLLETGAGPSALRSGIVGGTLRENGLALMAAGVTSLDELSVHLDLAD